MKISNPQENIEILTFTNAQNQQALQEASNGYHFFVSLRNSRMTGEQLSVLRGKGVLVVHGQKLLKSSPAQVAFEYNQNRVRMLIARKAIGEKKNRISSKLAELKSAVKIIEK